MVVRLDEGELCSLPFRLSACNPCHGMRVTPVPDGFTGPGSLAGTSSYDAAGGILLERYEEQGGREPREDVTGHARDYRATGRQAADNVRWDRVGRILAVVNGRWALTILRHLASGISRPADLLHAVNASSGNRLSNKVMFEVLRRLIDADILRRAEVPGVPRETHYWLTAAGHEILDEVSKLGASTPGGLPSMEPGPPPPDVDVTSAHPARIWDFFLGGKDNFAPDREAASRVIEAMPSLPVLARTGRRFQADAVHRLLERGTRQFLDIGTGLPAAGSVHELTQRLAPESRIVYVDNDPLVVTYARALLTSSPQGAYSYIEADLREPGKILAQAAQTLDLARPVAILLLGILHFIPDADDPWAITGRLMNGITGGGYLIIGHGASDITPGEAADMADRYNQRSAVPIRMRTKPEVARFFKGLQMLEPGLVPLAQWWPSQPGEASPGADLAGYVGIGWRHPDPPAQGSLSGPRRQAAAPSHFLQERRQVTDVLDEHRAIGERLPRP
jgi:DNA-binding HxlR family transcriptional regulator